MIYVICAIIASVILCFVAGKFKKSEKVIYITLVTMSILIEVFYFVYKVLYTNKNILMSLPIYWCAITNIMQIIGWITKNQKVLRFTVFMVIGPMFSLVFAPKMNGFQEILYYFSYSHIIMSLFTSFGLNYNKYDFEHSISVVNSLSIYFIVFELIYPNLLNALYGYTTVLLEILQVFNEPIYNIYFIFIVGYIFLFSVNLLIIDPILILYINKIKKKGKSPFCFLNKFIRIPFLKKIKVV